NYRFCVSCGASLRGSPSVPASAAQEAAHERPRSAVPQGPPSSSSRSAPSPSTEEKIVPMPVVEIAAAQASTRQKTIACPRCHGQGAPATRYCKYCGASLDEGGRSDPEATEVDFEQAKPPPLPPRTTPPRAGAPSPRPSPEPPPVKPQPTDPGR